MGCLSAVSRDVMEALYYEATVLGTVMGARSNNTGHTPSSEGEHGSGFNTLLTKVEQIRNLYTCQGETCQGENSIIGRTG